MDPELLQWSQTPEAQPYLQQAEQMLAGSLFGSTPQAGGLDVYGRFLQSLILDNPQNPQFQNQVLGYYLDYANPINQRQWGMDENKLNTGLSLLSSEDENLQRAGLSLISEAYPTLNEYMDVGGYTGGAPQTYEDVIRQQAIDRLKNPEGMSQRDFEWNSFLANATDEQIRQYLEAKKMANPLHNFDPYWSGTGVYNPFDASFWSKERAAQAKMGYY
ncbi:MAG TPA: hypothetical protein PLT50_03155 [bacterium]|jgi:hypothetical protein|nr:hypothetical protein [bacterium]